MQYSYLSESSLDDKYFDKDIERYIQEIRSAHRGMDKLMGELTKVVGATTSSSGRAEAKEINDAIKKIQSYNTKLGKINTSQGSMIKQLDQIDKTYLKEVGDSIRLLQGKVNAHAKNPNSLLSSKNLKDMQKKMHDFTLAVSILGRTSKKSVSQGEVTQQAIGGSYTPEANQIRRETAEKVSRAQLGRGREQLRDTVHEKGALEKELKRLYKQYDKVVQQNASLKAEIRGLKKQLKFSFVSPKAMQPSPQAPVDTEQAKTDYTELAKNILPQILDNLSTIFINLNKAISNFISQVGSATATIVGAIGDILDNPLQSIISVINGITQYLNQGLDFLSSVISSITNAISSLFGGDDSDSKKKKPTIAGSLLKFITGIISSLISIAVKAIESAFSVFSQALTQIFKIVKKIAMSSPIIRQILELIELAFNLFFMPFMNAFALVLLDKVVQLLDWAVETGQKFGEKGAEIAELIFTEDSTLDNILQELTAFAEVFMQDYLPQILELIPDVITFALDFAQFLVQNKDSIFEFITKGLNVFEKLLEGGLISSFLQISTTVFKWIDRNADELVEFVKTMLNFALNLANWFLGFFKGGDGSYKMGSGGYAQDSGRIAQEATDMISQINSEAGTTEYQPYDGTRNPRQMGTYQATGGIFSPKSSRGIPVIAGEANENEYRFTQNELEEIGKDTTITVQYYGDIMTKTDFKKMVQGAVSDVSNKAYFR